MAKKIQTVVNFIDWGFLFRLTIVLIFFWTIEVINAVCKKQESQIAALQAENAALKAK